MSTKAYYCYTCDQYFKVKLEKDLDIVRCIHCDSDDTEHSPEEEDINEVEDNDTVDMLSRNHSKNNYVEDLGDDDGSDDIDND